MTGHHAPRAAALRAHLEAWSPPEPVEIRYNGDPRDRPVNVPWVREKVVPQDSEVASMGDTLLVRTNGVYFLDVFVPAARGIGCADELADSLLDHFAVRTEVTVDGVTTTVEGASRSGDRDDDGWLMVPCVIVWQSHTDNPI